MGNTGKILLSIGLGLPSLVGCEEPPLVAGGRQTCVTDEGRVRCWGAGQYGVLGYGNTNNIGDNEHPAVAGDVSVGGNVEQLAAGYYHTCALLDTGRVRCWGRNNDGQLGLRHTNHIGDNELPSSAALVSLGDTATQITAGTYHTCALLTSGAVRCWGWGAFGQLGYGNTNSVGDDEHPSAVGPVSLGGTATQVMAGAFHTCAVLTTGAVRCWGANSAGQLGSSTAIFAVGDDELPSSLPVVAVGGVVDSMALGEQHSCARLGTNVKCWGHGAYGQLGYRSAASVSNPASVGMVNVGAAVQTVTAGGNQTCVLTTGLRVRCWGEGQWGPLGYGNQNNIGITQHPADAGDVSLGGDAISISAGYDHTCAVVNASSTMRVRCWGNNAGGVLGRGTSGNVGDDELPSSVPFVIVE